MINTNTNYENMFNSVARQFVGRVELLEGSTLLNVFEHDGALKSFTIDRTGAYKFFGYGVTQKITMILRDPQRQLDIQKGQRLQAAFGIENDYLYTCPVYIIDEVSRDENTNDLTVMAYDPIYTANQYKVVDMRLPFEFTLRAFAIACGAALGLPVDFINIPEELLDLTYLKTWTPYYEPEDPSTIRDALDDLAEMFGAIYYVCNDWNLTFKRLDVAGEPVAAINKSKYFTLTAKTAHTLADIMSVTELGDNITTTTGIQGETFYLRENAFLDREDVAELLEKIIPGVQALTIYTLDCQHRGDFRLEIGDKVGFTTKDDQVIESYILSDTITYNGGLTGSIHWEYAGEGETEGSPTSLGDALKRTYARVDHANNQIELVAGELSTLKLTENEIQATVEKVATDTQNALDATNEQVDSLTQRVQASMTAEDVQILIQQEVTSGASSVVTSTGFIFNDEGLNISKSSSVISTQITEDGMRVYRHGSEVLRADSAGVTAEDLHAKTYLIIGNTSRLEDWEGYTACFWIG